MHGSQQVFSNISDAYSYSKRPSIEFFIWSIPQGKDPFWSCGENFVYYGDM
jgi:hypothetical protein